MATLFSRIWSWEKSNGCGNLKSRARSIWGFWTWITWRLLTRGLREGILTITAPFIHTSGIQELMVLLRQLSPPGFEASSFGSPTVTSVAFCWRHLLFLWRWPPPDCFLVVNSLPCTMGTFWSAVTFALTCLSTTKGLGRQYILRMLTKQKYTVL